MARRARRALRRLLRVAGAALIGLCVFYAVLGGAYGLPRLIELREDVRTTTAERDRLRVRVDSLTALRDSLKQDPRAIERVARERYGLIQDGETLYRFVYDD